MSTRFPTLRALCAILAVLAAGATHRLESRLRSNSLSDVEAGFVRRTDARDRSAVMEDGDPLAESDATQRIGECLLEALKRNCVSAR